MSDLEVRIEESGARVQVGDLPTIDADHTQMRQLLQNLISNGLKFRRDGEAPIVQVSGRSLNGHEAGLDEGPPSTDGLCEISVKDNGVGFDEKYLDRIFDAFQRLQARGVYEGTGIGLAICRKIVERHHGTIAAKSEPGQGATFIITLPATQRGEDGRWEDSEAQSRS